MDTIKKLTIIIPCYNEQEGIKTVLDDIPHEKLNKLGFSVETIVIDNNSTDNTSKIALYNGAKVIHEKKQGKGHAMITGFNSIPKDSDVVVMIDGDASYDIKEVIRLIEPIESGFADGVVGTRLHGKLDISSMSSFNRIGNWFFTFLARTGYRTNVTDVCSGFFAWKGEVIQNLAKHIKSSGFSLEMEMIVKMARMGYDCYSVPITYNLRNGSSSLKPVRDGLKIAFTWLKYLTWNQNYASQKKESTEKQTQKEVSAEKVSSP